MTTHCKQSCVLALLALLVSACDREAVDPAEMAPGQEPYLQYCASCHGNAGQGKPPAFPPLDGSEWVEALPPEGLALIVLYGLRGEIEVAGRTYRGFMPPMRNISDEDIAAIVGYMDRSWAGRKPVLDADDVAELRGAFQGQSPMEGWQGVEEVLEMIR